MKRRDLLLVMAVLFGSVPLAHGQEARIWTGIFTDEQADRGKADFAQSCTRCHGQDLAGLTAPSLNGNRFITAWENENLYKLFVKIRDTTRTIRWRSAAISTLSVPPRFAAS